MQAENGISIEILAQTAYEAYRSASSGQKPWELADRSAWEAVAGQAIITIESADGLQFRELAAKLMAAYQLASGFNLEFEDIGLEPQLWWEATARHLANIIDSDGSVEISKHEGGWGKWVKEKIIKSKSNYSDQPSTSETQSHDMEKV